MIVKTYVSYWISHIRQVLPQLSCGDTCQIWMWFKESNRYHCKINNFAYREIEKGALVTTTPGLKAPWESYWMIDNIFKNISYANICKNMCFSCSNHVYLNTNHTIHEHNKANLRGLIAATCLVILLKLDLNRRFFSPCDLEIWWMTPKNNRAPLLCYFKLFASFRSHWWIQTGVTVRKHLIWVKINAFLAVWPWNLSDDLQKQ